LIEIVAATTAISRYLLGG